MSRICWHGWSVKPAADLTAAYPQRTAARVHVIYADGQTVFSREQSDYEGSPTRPMSWDRVVEKFHWLAEPFCDEGCVTTSSTR